MHIPNPYFSNIPQLGNLTLDYILWKMATPFYLHAEMALKFIFAYVVRYLLCKSGLFLKLALLFLKS